MPIPERLRQIPEPEIEARIASRRWALARLKPLPASWSPKGTASHATHASPNLLRLVQDVAPVALEGLDAQLKATAEQTKALKAERAQLKQLAAVAAGGE